MDYDADTENEKRLEDQDIDHFMVNAIIAFDKLPLASDALFQKAREIGCVIERFNWTRATCYGLVLGQDDKAWLIQVSSKIAGVLPFCEIEGGVVPRFGDRVRLEFRHGLVKVEVTICPKNARFDAANKPVVIPEGS